jgi:hypothetical protein
MLLVGYVVLALTYLLGGALLAGGVYLVRHKTFPKWWSGFLLRPLVNITPRVTHLQGWASVAFGVSVLAIGSGALLADVAGGILVIAGMLGYLVGVALFVYSTWLSRRAAD